MFRCAVATQVFAWAVIAGGVLAIAGLVAMVVSGLGFLPLVILLIVLSVLGIGYLWWFALHPKLIIDDQVHVVNPLHRHTLERDEIRSVEPGPNGLVIEHGSGVVEAWAIQKGNRRLRRGIRSRADVVAEQVVALLEGRSPQSPTSATSPDSPLSPSSTPSPATPASPPTPVGRPSYLSAMDASSPATPDTQILSAQGAGDPAPDEPTGPDVPSGDDEDDEGDDLIIRRARKDDLDTLAELEQDITTTGPETAGPWWDEVLGDRTYKVRIAEIDGEPVGYLCYDADELHRIGLVSGSDNLANHQSVLDYALDEMAARGTTVATLRLTGSATADQDRYRSLGWASNGEATSDAVTMTLDLTDRQ